MIIFLFILTLTYRAHDIGFKLCMLFKHWREALSGVFCRSLSAMSVKDGKAAVITCALEVLLNHKLYKKKMKARLVTLLKISKLRAIRSFSVEREMKLKRLFTGLTRQGKLFEVHQSAPLLCPANLVND